MRPVQGGRVSWGIVAAIVAALAAAAPALAAKDVRLSVKKVASPPEKAAAGDSIAIGGKVVNKGRDASRAKLTAELRGDGVTYRLGRERVRVRSKARKRFDFDESLPGKVDVGDSLKLAVCVPREGTAGRDRCGKGKGKVTVVGPPEPPPPTIEYVAGSRTLDDPLLPQIGNGGYDAAHYEIDLDYDPAANELLDASTTMTATATANLRELSLDFQDVLDVSSVQVNGQPAGFAAAEATPDLSDDPSVTQPMKLVVTPADAARPLAGETFTVAVDYSGVPAELTDPDTSIEGWIRACYPLTPPRTCDGSFVVNEPMGAQSWFPSNNYPTDKATFDTMITVPNASTALGVGELASRTDNGDGTMTWHWSEDDPTATYLTTATVGDFIYEVESMVETSTSRALAIYNAIDSSADPLQVEAIRGSLDQAPGQLNFLSDLYGAYPFDSTGAVADRATGVGYALEVQTKPHYSGSFTLGNPGIDIGTQLHEISHQWFGNGATLEAWSDIWFNEGWANWSEWYWQFLENGGEDPAALFDDLYADTPPEDWGIAPAVLDGDPANLFAFFPTYQRGAMTLQGYREIVGDETFFELARTLLDDFGYGNVSTQEFIATATAVSGLTGADLDLLDQYFEQWLYGETRPTILPEDFGP
jgi:aminopeptidase N